MTRSINLSFRISETEYDRYRDFKEKIHCQTDSNLIRTILMTGLTVCEYLYSTNQWTFNHVRVRKFLETMDLEEKKYLLDRLKAELENDN